MVAIHDRILLLVIEGSSCTCVTQEVSYGLLFPDGPDGKTLLGVLDYTWVFFYAISSYIR